MPSYSICPLEGYFKSREQPKVIQSEIWLGGDMKVFLGEELLHSKEFVVQCFIVMWKLLSLPLVAPLPPNCITQPLQNLLLQINDQ
jgi:hypothetical protein